MRFLVTGTAGFIGFHLSRELLRAGHDVAGFDNMNDYYDVNLKRGRIDAISKEFGASVAERTCAVVDLRDRSRVAREIRSVKPDVVINLAAQAGVRYSIEQPERYIESNIAGFQSILDGCIANNVNHLMYASRSSVYGRNTRMPFKESDNTDTPMSLYAATKKANEAMAYSYSSLHGIKTTGLRFFTAYGPWGRPDMALYIFAKAAYTGEEVRVFNRGKMYRDFTYVGDIVKGVRELAEGGNKKETSMELYPECAPSEIFNIGSGKCVKLMSFMEEIEAKTGRTIAKNYCDLQAGDVPMTYSSTMKLKNYTGFSPSIDIKEGIERFIEWFEEYELNRLGICVDSQDRTKHSRDRCDT